jgi:6,7-dimethyl-8-ribityllumazine synthase
MPSTRYDADGGAAPTSIEGVKVHTGTLDAAGMRFGVVASRFNDIISTPLLQGAVEMLQRHGALTGDIEVVWVPGAFEVPIAARELAERGDIDAVVCVGAVIRGDTPHFDYVAGEAARGVASVHATTGVPATFGVLTVDTVEQATDRAGGRLGNKGAEAAEAAIEMVSVLRELRTARPGGHLAVS